MNRPLFVSLACAFVQSAVAQSYPLYPISVVTTEDAAGIADSLGIKCALRGVVLGENLRVTGLQFTLHDGTGGISVFSFSSVSGYAVSEGDSIHVQGTIDQFNGLVELIPDSIGLVSQGNPLPVMRTVTQLDETIESELVKLVGFWFVDTTQWTPGAGTGFSYDVTNGSDTFACRIDDQINLFTMPRPPGYLLNFSGIGSQYDYVSPYTSNYEIVQRSDADIEATQTPDAAFFFVQYGLDVDFIDLSANCPLSWFWDFGDGATDTGQNVSHSYAQAGVYTVCLTVANPAGSDSSCQTLIGSGIQHHDYEQILVLPNPATDVVRIVHPEVISAVRVLNLTGELILECRHCSAVHVGDLRPGMYLAVVLTANGYQKGPFIRQ